MCERTVYGADENTITNVAENRRRPPRPEAERARSNTKVRCGHRCGALAPPLAQKRHPGIRQPHVYESDNVCVRRIRLTSGRNRMDGRGRMHGTDAMIGCSL